ncbi:MAG: sterol desaturase family protein [Pseudomonadota bacterium]
MAIWTTVLVWLGYSAWGSATWATALPLIGAGWLLLTGVEYSLHRWAFHWKPKSDLMKQVVFIMHGNHHMQPMDKMRSLMPPVVSFPIGIGVAALLEAAFGQASEWMLFGFLLGYVAYDLTHYGSHQWAMRGPIARRLKRHHMLHHFVSEDGNYAVTALFWDRLFRTDIKLGKRAKPARVILEEAPEPAE